MRSYGASVCQIPEPKPAPFSQRCGLIFKVKEVHALASLDPGAPVSYRRSREL